MLLTQLFSGLIAAVVIALGAGQNGNNNTQVGEESVVATSQYYYTSDSDDPSDENEPTNWVLLTNQDGNCEQSGPTLCTIEAPAGDGIHPDFSMVSDVRTSPNIDLLSFKQ